MVLALRILGELECRRDGEVVDLGGPRPRIVLALLVLNRGSLVDRGRLIEAIWASEPPDSAATQVAIHVSALRKALGERVIETVESSYRLVSGEVELDAVEAERRCVEARRAGSPDDLWDALQLWRGPVLDGLHSLEQHPEVRRLEELRLVGHEDWALFELERERPAGPLDVLPEVVAEHPFREGLRTRLMEALWRSGRRADALEQYAEARELLATELGLDPGSGLQNLQLRILRAEEPGGRSTPSPRVVDSEPHQLPLDVRLFTGRTEQLRLLDESVRVAEQGATVALHGPGGAGKSTLAVHWAHLVVDRFPDGQVFLNLRGHDVGDPVAPTVALHALLSAFGVPEGLIPASGSARSELLRRHLAAKRALIVLDNARDSEHVRPLLPGGDATVVVTSRSQLRSLATRENARRIAVPELPEDDAVALLAGRLDNRDEVHTGDGQSELRRLAGLCGRLPVALAIAAERANRYEQVTLADLNSQLGEGRRALDNLVASEQDPSTSVRAVLAWSYDALDDDAAHQFRVLGLHPHPVCGASAAAALSGNPIGRSEQLLNQLVDTHLLHEPQPGEYEMHDLVQAFAVELSDTMSGEERAAADDRLLAGYRHTLANARRSIGRPILDLNPADEVPAGVTPLDFDDPSTATAWVSANRDAVLATLTHAAERGEHAAVCRLGPLATWTLNSWTSQRETEFVNELVSRSAHAVGDRFTEALCIGSTGDIHWGAGRDAEALNCFEREIALHRETGHRVGELVATARRGILLGRLGRVDESIDELEHALESAPALDLPTGQFRNHLACAYLRAASFESALATAEAAVQENEGGGARYHLANAHDTLGWANAAVGSYEQAQEGFRRAIDTFDQVVPQVEAARSWTGLGWTQYELGDGEGAARSWQEALRIFDELEAADNNIAARGELRRLVAAVEAGESLETPDYALMG